MKIIIILFWILLSLVIYSYVGYPIILYILVKIKSLFSQKKEENNNNISLPEVTLFVAAYNEKDYIATKMENHLNLNYPKNKIKHLWVTDGSNDGTPELLKKYPEVIVLHENKRNGKIGAINRGKKYITTPIVIFSDGNTILSKNSIKIIVDLFKDSKVGCVAGEKRIYNKNIDDATGSGESFYWKFESKIKKWDAELYSAVGAAGELFAVRTELLEEVEPDTILDDFIISLRIVKKGYTIKYNPKAYAIETASANIKEELKRKIRISAGSIQSIIRLKSLLNPFKYGIFSWQFFSHKIARWIIVPFSLPIIYILNALIILKMQSINNIYTLLFFLQTIFYLFVFIGWIFKNKKIKFKLIFIPYYIYIMNYAVWVGLYRFIRGKQTVNWERAKRA
ncbi:MAG: glycosyltransferase family 2 protein [Chlorobi bacterium]|nr:glycosyltransferase family 2 protein [Chlorobiota bacterium]